MIATQRITTISAKPIQKDGFETINVLKWDKSRWKELCPYYLRTDGDELQANDGGILFENYYQGSKVYSKVHSIDVYPSRYQEGNAKYLMWSYRPLNGQYDRILVDDIIDYELYFRWRKSLWECQKPIRYPNYSYNRKDTQFALLIEKDGHESRLNYIEARDILYVREYKRLVRKTEAYGKLLQMLKDGKNLLICEIDVPANGKRGLYGDDCDETNTCIMSKEKVTALRNDESEAFGHGLALVDALFEDQEVDA